MSLRAGDYRRVLEVAGVALGCAGPGFPDIRVTGLLRDAFQADLAGAGRVDLRGTGSRAWGGSPRPIQAAAGFHAYAISHPLTGMYRRTGQPHPMRASDLPGCREVPGCGTADMSRLLVIPLAITAGDICAIALMRGGADFTDRDVAVARELRPLLSSVYSLRGRLDQAGPAGGDARDGSAGIAITPRELAVLDLMADGLIAAAIARRLGISPRTVSRHMESIYGKLNVHDRTSAVLRANALRGRP